MPLDKLTACVEMYLVEIIEPILSQKMKSYVGMSEKEY